MARELNQDEMIEMDDPGEHLDERDVLAWVNADSGRLSLNTMLDEIAELEAIRTLQPPDDSLGDVASNVIAAWRARAAVQAPSHLRELASKLRWTVRAALLVLRQQEITGNLVELLISTEPPEVPAPRPKHKGEFGTHVDVENLALAPS